MAPTNITITGSLWHPSTGAKITTGRLHIFPGNFNRSNGELISANEVTYNIPGNGNISMTLVPSGTVTYTVEFDPNPSDNTTPRAMKSGYFKDTWTVPGSGPIDISTL